VIVDGEELARAFAGRGASLLLTGRREEVLEPLARELGGIAVVAALASRAGLRRIVEAARRDWPRVLAKAGSR